MAQLPRPGKVQWDNVVQKLVTSKVYLPLDLYERAILEDAAAVFPCEPDKAAKVDISEIFGFSSWAKHLKWSLCTLIYDGDIKMHTPEDVLSTWKRITTHLEGDMEGMKSDFRVELIEQFNPHILEIVQACEGICVGLKRLALGLQGLTVETGHEDLESTFVDSEGGIGDWNFMPIALELAGRMIKPVSHDLQYWIMFAEFIHHIDKDSFELGDSGGGSSIKSRKKKTAPTLPNAHDDGTYPIWRLVKEFAITYRRTDNEEKVREFLAHAGFYETHTEFEDGVAVPIGLSGQKMNFSRFKIPYKSLEYIPWAELQAVAREYNLSDPAMPRVRWCGSPKGKFEYMFCSEEEVLRYCVLNNFAFPDARVDGDPQFVVIDWQDSDLILHLDKYIPNWNDCAITQDTSGSWKVLETIPGLKFRKFHRETDRFAYRQFRSMCEQHRLGSQDWLKLTMGPSYDKDLEYLLSAIPFHAFDKLSARKIASGARGTVYAANWHRPESAKEEGYEIIPVALKSVAVSSQPEAHLDERRLVKELQNATLTQQRRGGGVIQLYGVTRSPDDLNNSILPSNTLFLVLEYALLGTLREYLKNRLNGTDIDWTTIHLIVLGLAGGLHAIHQSGFVHRDIHWDNLLVTRRKLRDNETQLSVVVSDLGEARQISSIDLWAGGRSYNNHEFRAPSPFDANSQPADVWALGYLILRMAKMHWDLRHTSIDPEVMEYTIPDCFKELIDKCLVKDPTDSPTAWDIVQVLEEYSNEHRDYDYEGYRIIFTMVLYDAPASTDSVMVVEEDEDDEIPY